VLLNTEGLGKGAGKAFWRNGWRGGRENSRRYCVKELEKIITPDNLLIIRRYLFRV